MKKTLLAVAIPAVLFAHSVSAVELYKADEGFVDLYGQLRFQAVKNEGDDVDMSAGSSRAGISSRYAVTDSVDVFGLVEFGLAPNGGDLDGRLHYGGVDTDFGKFTFGRQWIVSDNFGVADYSYYNGGTGNLSSVLSGARHDSFINYTFEGSNFIVSAGYGLPEDDANQELAELYAGTSLGGFNLHIGGGVNRDKSFTLKDEDKNEIDADIENTYYEGTVEYAFGPALIGFTYYNSELKHKTSGVTIDQDAFTVAGTYSWAENATAYAGYEFVDQESKALNVDGDGKVFYIGSDYHFNSWFRVFAEYAYKDGTTLGYTNTNADVAVGPTAVDGESVYFVGARVYF